MRRYLLFFLLCGIFFLLPLQVFVIGDSMGIGIQGAVYRLQWTEYGTYFFPITREFVFVLNGTYFGRTALSVILWLASSVLLACTTIYAFFHINDAESGYFRQIAYGLVASCIIWLGSCIAQYGFFLHGEGGMSVPLGLFLIICWVAYLFIYRQGKGRSPIQE